MRLQLHIMCNASVNFQMTSEHRLCTFFSLLKCGSPKHSVAFLCQTLAPTVAQQSKRFALPWTIMLFKVHLMGCSLTSSSSFCFWRSSRIIWSSSSSSLSLSLSDEYSSVSLRPCCRLEGVAQSHRWDNQHGQRWRLTTSWKPSADLTSVCLRSLRAAARSPPFRSQSVAAAPAPGRSAPPAPSGSRFPEQRQGVYKWEPYKNSSKALGCHSVLATFCWGSWKRNMRVRMTHLCQEKVDDLLFIFSHFLFWNIFLRETCNLLGNLALAFLRRRQYMPIQRWMYQKNGRTEIKHEG